MITSRTKLVLTLLVIVTSFVFPMTLRASSKIINIAVLDFNGKNVSAADASIVTDFVRTELVKSGKYNVIDKYNMDKILSETSFQQSGCTETDCAVQIGKILNVNKMVVGTLSKLEGTYYITTNVVDVQTGKIEMSETKKCKSADQLMNVCYDLADSYIEHDFAVSTQLFEPEQIIETNKPLIASKQRSIEKSAKPELNIGPKKSFAKRIFFGIGNPYVSFGYDLTPKYASEFRFAADISDNENKVKIYNLRLYYNSSLKKLACYACIEGGLIDFKGYDANGAKQTRGGYLVGVFLGTKLAIAKRIHIKIDMGPSYIVLGNNIITGVEWIANAGIEIYVF